MERKPYPSDVRDDAWAFVAPYVTLMTADAPQRDQRWREVLNGRRGMVRAGAAWRLMPPDLPPWYPVSQQSQRGCKAGGGDIMGLDLRAWRRVAHGRTPQPSAALVASRTMPATPASGARAGFAPATGRRGSQGHRAGDTLGPLLAVLGTPANAQARQPVAAVAQHVQAVTGDAVEWACVAQAYTGQQAAHEAAATHRELAVVKRLEAPRGFGLLPRRGVVERRQGWAARFRRLAREYEQWVETLTGLHVGAFARFMLQQLTTLIL